MGDERYEDYVRARSPALRRTAYLLCGDWQRAEDAVQAVLIALYVRPPNDWAAVDAWTRTALVRRVIDESRRPWRRRERSVSTLPDAPADSGEATDRLDLVAALRRLPERQRAVVVLRYWEGLDVAQTAAALRISEGTVKSHTSRALAALRLVMEDSSA